MGFALIRIRGLIPTKPRFILFVRVRDRGQAAYYKPCE